MDRSKLTRNILLGMMLGLLIGSLIHLMALDSQGIFSVYVVDGIFDVGGRVFIASL